MVATNTAVRTPRFLGVHRLVLDHQTWERRTNLMHAIKIIIFMGVLDHELRKKLKHKILQHENFAT